MEKYFKEEICDSSLAGFKGSFIFFARDYKFDRENRTFQAGQRKIQIVLRKTKVQVKRVIYCEYTGEPPEGLEPSTC